MMQRRLRANTKKARGFALAAILWLLAGLTVLVVSVSTSLLAVSRSNHDTEERVRLLLSEQRALADVSYLTLTYKTLGAGALVGSKVLLLDGSTRYTLEDGASVVLQDMQGLVGLNSPGPDDLRRLLALCGVAPDKADVLMDALLDYQDVDSLKRINGAEFFEYAAAGLNPPRNQPLLDVSELGQVYGWRQVLPLWLRYGCDDAVSLGLISSVNLWTAPLSVLRAVGMSAVEAQAAQADRDQNRSLPRLSPYLLAYRDRGDNAGLGIGRFAVRSRGQIRVTVARGNSAGLVRSFVLDRGGFNHVLPFTRSQFRWMPQGVATTGSSIVNSPRDRALPAGDRFTDNLSGFFTAIPGTSSNASDAQLPLFPTDQP